MPIVYDGSNDPLCKNTILIEYKKSSQLYLLSINDMFACAFNEIVIFPRFIVLKLDALHLIVSKVGSILYKVGIAPLPMQCFIEYDDRLYVWSIEHIHELSLTTNKKTTVNRQDLEVVDHSNILIHLVKHLPQYDPTKLQNIDYIGSLKKIVGPYTLVKEICDITVYCNH